MTEKRPLHAPDGTPASRFAFGTMQFGGRADDHESEAMFKAARAAGINFFDTAHAYNEGRSERLLGRFAAPERDRLVIATKAAYVGGSGRENILSSFEESRQRLDMDAVDILYLHRWDEHTPLEETFGALADIVARGQARYIGVSNFAAWQTMKAERVANALGISITILQPMYNLVKRQVEVEILPMARSEGFRVTPYSPLGGGLLTGKYAAGAASGRLTEDDAYATRYGLQWMHDAARGLAGIAAELGVHPATLAVAWVAANPDVDHPIISARNVSQLAPSLAATEFEMDPALRARLSGLVPAPPPATDRLEEA
ncbi:MAG: aldo/keto reductase [Alphaproteobacteria bacterium]|nr:MAG: aldo/keto reductase [Alphaproteobacteria bacterium]